MRKRAMLSQITEICHDHEMVTKSNDINIPQINLDDNGMVKSERCGKSNKTKIKLNSFQYFVDCRCKLANYTSSPYETKQILFV